MNESNTNVNPDELETGEGQGGEDVTERLQRLESDAIVQRILADPDIQSVLKAKQSGKAFKIVEDTPEEPAEEPNTLTADMEDDDPMKEPLSKIEQMLRERIDSKFEELTGRLSSVEETATEIKRREVTDQIKATRSKYKDFDQYRTEMVELARSNPSLDAEQLYLLARHKKGQLRLAEQITAQERPTASPRPSLSQKKPSNNNGQSNQKQQGRRAQWSSGLADALSRMDLSQGNE